jgi:hypothetical protein
VSVLIGPIAALLLLGALRVGFQHAGAKSRMQGDARRIRAGMSAMQVVAATDGWVQCAARRGTDSALTLLGDDDGWHVQSWSASGLELRTAVYATRRDTLAHVDAWGPATGMILRYRTPLGKVELKVEFDGDGRVVSTCP